jgi:hypothetical protein
MKEVEVAFDEMSGKKWFDCDPKEDLVLGFTGHAATGARLLRR